MKRGRKVCVSGADRQCSDIWRSVLNVLGERPVYVSPAKPIDGAVQGALDVSFQKAVCPVAVAGIPMADSDPYAAGGDREMDDDADDDGNDDDDEVLC